MWKRKSLEAHADAKAHNGDEKNYIPDFVVRVNDGTDDPLNLIIDVTGQTKKVKQAKASTVRNLWVPAMNNYGRFGRRAFIEIKDTWNSATLIREFLQTGDYRP